MYFLDIETVYVRPHRPRICTHACVHVRVFMGIQKPIHRFSWGALPLYKIYSALSVPRRRHGGSDLRIFPIRRSESEKERFKFARARESAECARRRGLGARRLFILFASVYASVVRGERGWRKKKMPNGLLGRIFSRRAGEAEVRWVHPQSDATKGKLLIRANRLWEIARGIGPAAVFRQASNKLGADRISNAKPI